MLRTARSRITGAVRRSAPPIAALSAVAVSQPLLDLFGRNPEFFVAKTMSATGVIAFGLAIALGLPLVLLFVVAVTALVSERSARVAHGLLVATLAAASALVILGRDQSSILIAAVLAVATGFAVSVAEQRWAGLRTGLRYLSPLPVLVLAMFLFASESSRLIWAPQAAAAPAEVVASPAPVSVLIFDELPLASLLGEDGTINGERFPNFARLADSGTWYRNATSPYAWTEVAVPAILSGTDGSFDAIPSTIDYPRNLFTMLADSHEMNVEEELTALCPTYACGPPESSGSAVDRSVATLADAAVLYGHRSLPAPARASLPPVNRSWSGFVGGDGGGAQNPFASRWDDPAGTQTQLGRVAYFDRMIAGMERGPKPTLNVAHGVFPHSPWTLTPDGNAYGSITEGLDFEDELLWSEDDEVVLHGQIQHLLQLGAADATLGRLIDQLEETGLWDESLVAVVGDHGAAFETGEFSRQPSEDNLDEVFRVPLIVKYPDQQVGSIDDEPAQTIDLVPTIADALDVETDWEFDGRSLLADDPADGSPSAFLRDGSRVDLDPSIEPLLALARRNHDRFPHRDDWLGVVAIGDQGRQVGRLLSDLDIRESDGWTWSTDRWDAFDDVGNGFVPIQFEGTVSGPPGSSDPDSFLIAVNGTIAGVGVRLSSEEPRTWSFSAIVAEELFRPGGNTVDLLVPDAGVDGAYLAVNGERDATMTAVTSGEDRVVAVRIGGREIEVSAADNDQMQLSRSFTDGRTVVVDGWATDAESDRAPKDVALFVDGERVSIGVSPYPPLAQPSGQLADWGFRLAVPEAKVGDATSGTVVALFDDFAVAVPVDWSD